jgi:hypothetical protein
MAVFKSVANPQSTNSIGTGISVGAGIWMVVLSIIATYFAGRLASTHSGATTRNSGIYAGLVTFGMCIFATFLIMALATIGARASVTRESSVGDYWLFVTLILSMIAAATGGVNGLTTGGLRVAPDSISETKRAA